MRGQIRHKRERLEHWEHWYEPSKDLQHVRFETAPRIVSFGRWHLDIELLYVVTILFVCFQKNLQQVSCQDRFGIFEVKGERAI